MDVVILTIELVSAIAICIMIGALVIAYVKKLMMTYALIIANLIVFFLTFIFYNKIISNLGFRPIYLSFEYLPQIYTLFSLWAWHSSKE